VLGEKGGRGKKKKGVARDADRSFFVSASTILRAVVGGKKKMEGGEGKDRVSSSPLEALEYHASKPVVIVVPRRGRGKRGRGKIGRLDLVSSLLRPRSQAGGESTPLRQVADAWRILRCPEDRALQGPAGRGDRQEASVRLAIGRDVQRKGKGREPTREALKTRASSWRITGSEKRRKGGGSTCSSRLRPRNQQRKKGLFICAILDNLALLKIA